MLMHDSEYDHHGEIESFLIPHNPNKPRQIITVFNDHIVATHEILALNYLIKPHETKHAP
jgi:hypothetical protein